jgi:hypothetical protein
VLVANCLLLAVSLLPGSVLFESGGFGSAWYLRTGNWFSPGHFGWFSPVLKDWRCPEI